MTPRWIEVQTRYLRRYLPVPYEVWASLEGIDPSLGAQHFDRVIESVGDHAGKLNQLALEITKEAKDEDLLMFLDSDAFPIADPMPLINKALKEAPLVAVRRAENGNDPQPHPCFCVTTVKTWRELGGDWSRGHTWTGPNGEPVSDVGGNLLRRLELTGTPWVEVLRSSGTDLNLVFFGVYGGVLYHHGAGSREGLTNRAEGARRPRELRAPGPLDPAARALTRARRRYWRHRRRGKLISESQRLYEKIERDDPSWLVEIA